MACGCVGVSKLKICMIQECEFMGNLIIKLNEIKLNIKIHMDRVRLLLEYTL